MKVGAVGAGLGVAMLPVVNAFTRFDDAIRAAGARAQASGAEFDAMKQKALELGRTTSFTAAEVADLMGELGTAGFKPTAIIAATDAVLDLARASGTEAALSAQILGSAVNQFELNASDATMVADALTVAANKSATTVQEIGYALSYVGTDAKRFNMSIQDTLAVLGGLANFGIRGEQGGTTLRRLLTLTGAEADKMKELFGVDAADAAGNMRPIVDVLEEINNSLAGMGNVAASAKLNEFFGILGITGSVTVGKAAGSIRELADALANANGEARRVAKEMDAGLGGSVRMLTSAVEGTAIAFGEALAPVLSQVSTWLQDVNARVTAFVNENRTAATTVAAVVAAVVGGATAASAAVLGLALAFKVVAVGVGLATAAVGLFKAALLAAVSPAGLLVGAMAGLGYLFATQTKAGQDMAERVGDGFRDMAATATEAWGGIKAAVAKGDFGQAVKIAMLGLKLEWTKVVLYWTEKWKLFKETMAYGWENLGTIIKNIFVEVFNWVGRRITDLLKLIADGMAAIGLETAAARVRRAAPADVAAAPAAPAPDAVEAARDAVRAAEEEFRRAIREAVGGWDLFDRAVAMAREAGVAVAPMPRAAGVAPMPREVVIPGPDDIIGAIRGATATPAGRRQFGYGDRIGEGLDKKQLEEQKKIRAAAEKTAMEIAGLALALRLR